MSTTSTYNSTTTTSSLTNASFELATLFVERASKHLINQKLETIANKSLSFATECEEAERIATREREKGLAEITTKMKLLADTIEIYKQQDTPEAFQILEKAATLMATYSRTKATLTNMSKSVSTYPNQIQLIKENAYNILAQLGKVKACAKFLKEHNGSIQALADAPPSLFESQKPSFTTEVSVDKAPAEKKIDKALAEEQANQVFAELLQGEELQLAHTAITSKEKPTNKQKPKRRQKQEAQSKKSIEPARTPPAFSSKPASPPTTSFKAKTIVQKIMQLNSSAPSASNYHLHRRVTRWHTNLKTDADFKAIELFADYIEGTVVHPYAGLDKKSLKYQRDSHNIGWAQRIISGPLAETYSFDHHYSDTQKGKALFASMHSDGEKKSGLLVLGIGADNVIYHAQFRPFVKEDILPNHVAKLLSVNPLAIPADEEETKSSAEQWQDTTSVKFSLHDKDIIKVKVTDTNAKQAKKKAAAKAEGATYFHIYPLV